MQGGEVTLLISDKRKKSEILIIQHWEVKNNF